MIELRGGIETLSFAEQRRLYYRVFLHFAQSSAASSNSLGYRNIDVHTSTELPSHLSLDSSNYAEVMASFNIWSPLEECEEFLDRLDAYYSLSLSRYSSLLTLLLPYT
jgi:hypothetical protein